MLSRRNFLCMVMALAGRWVFSGSPSSWGSLFPNFFFTQLKYRQGQWDPNPLYAAAMVEELELRTSIDARKDRRIMDLTDPQLFFCPLIYMAGRSEFGAFTEQERAILRRFLTYGGFLFAEDTLGAPGFEFDKAFRNEMKQTLPHHKLERLSRDHTVYRSFYLLDEVAGRQKIIPYFEGITIDNWTPVIYSQNDLSGAWSRDKYGKWVNECVPGGEPQRQAAFKAGINIIVYCLTSEYKRDALHQPFIQKRRD